LLIALRFVQGLAIGGQWGGAVLIITENAPPTRRGFYGSFAQVGAPAGVILANLAFLIVNASVSPEDFMAWGWRVPFVLSVLLLVLALWIQLRLEDTPAFRELSKSGKEQRPEPFASRTQDPTSRAKIETSGAIEQTPGAIEQTPGAIEQTPGAIERTSAAKARTGRESGGERQTSPVFDALRIYPREIGLAAGAFIAIQVTFYILVAFILAYGTNPAGLGLPRSTMLAAVLIGAVVMIPALIASAAISDRYGRRGIYMTGAVLLGAWGFALFPLVDTGSFLWITVAISIGQVLVATMYGPQAAFFTEMFSTKVRYSGASLSYQLGAILGGALAPLLATALLAKFGSTLAISIYMAITCAISFVSVVLLPETYRAKLHEES